MSQIYLDYNATTPIADEVSDAIIPYLREHYGNPSSSHTLGRKCKEAIDDSRSQVARLIGARPEEIYFTSGGTESNNLTIKGIFLEEGNQTGHFITSCFEHPAIKNPALFHQSCGGKVSWIGTDDQGIVDLNELAAEMNDHTKLVSIMHANNEIGSVQPIEEISKLCREKGIPLHTDAAQSIGKIPVNVEKLGVDFLTIAGHKLYAPKGIGALYIRSGHKLVPSIHGAGHECGVRPGTENVPYIVGLGVAARILGENAEHVQLRMQELRNRLESQLISAIPGLIVNASLANRLPNTSSLGFPGIVAAQMLTQVPDLCVSTGAACHSDTVTLSDSLQAIGLTEDEGAGVVRISCGRHTSEEEIDEAAKKLRWAWERACE